LAGCTSSDVFSDEGFHVGPPIIGGNKLEGLGNPRVSRCFMVMKKGNYPPPKSIVCHDNKGSTVVPMGTINSGKIIWASPLFKCRLLGVLGMFNVLFQGVFKTVPVCDMDVGVCFTEVSVWPNCNVFIIWISINLVIGAAGKGVCTICGSWFIFQQDIVLFPFREISCDAWPNFSGVTIVLEVCMVSIYQDGDRCSF
jgi:hypothetical protein